MSTTERSHSTTSACPPHPLTRFDNRDEYVRGGGNALNGVIRDQRRAPRLGLSL
jgi:hypothetical protein